MLVTNFYNMLRKKCWNVKPNEGHRLVAALEEKYDVTVVTQNVDNLHEQAGSSRVIHLHGELMKVCSSRNVDGPRYIQQLTPDNCEIAPGTKAGDGSLLRPYIVFFGEAVPNITVAAEYAQQADIFIIIGTSLNVYPAAGSLCAPRRACLSDRPQARQRRQQCHADYEGCFRGNEGTDRTALNS